MQEPTNIESSPKKEFPIYIKGFILVIKLIGYLFFTFLLGGLIGEGLTALTPQLEHVDMISGNLENWESLSIFYLGLTIAALFCTWFFRKYIDQRAVATIGLKWQNVGANLVKGGAWAIGLQTIVFVFLLIGGMLSVEMDQFDGVELAGFFFFFVLVAINEELIFRGYITSLLTFTIHFLPAIIVSSLLFAAVHIGNADFTWMGFGSIFFGGYLLGLFYLKYQNLYLPIGMHLFWNFYQGNILGFDVSGMAIPSLIKLKMDGLDWVTGGEFGLEGSIITVVLLLAVSVFLTWKWYEELGANQKGAKLAQA